MPKSAVLTTSNGDVANPATLLPRYPTTRMLRAKALECVSLVGMAVGRERFRNDAAAVMAFMGQLGSAQLESDDPTHSYMLQVCA